MKAKKAKILVSDEISKEGIEMLKSDADVDFLPGLAKDDLISKIDSYDALVVRSQTEVTEDVVSAGSRLKVIGRAGSGVDNIDVDAATKGGVIVINAPEGNTISTAEHTIAMMMAMSRNIPQADLSLKSKKWVRKKYIGTEVNEKVLGVVGLGRVGSEVAKRALGIGMKVVAYDPFISEEKLKKLGIDLLRLGEIIRKADYITVHTPLTDDTHNLIGEKEFKNMKDGVRIINCARGGIINEKSLLKAIKEGKVAGAALDVFENEPPVDSELLDCDKIIVTPHIGASTKEAQFNVAVIIADQVIKALKGEPVKNAINMLSVKPEAFESIKPYLLLAEKMGSLSAQLITGHIGSVEVEYSGEISEKDTRVITISMLKGLLDPILGSNVNFVNAPLIAKNRGIKIVESKTETVESFISLITLRLDTDKETKKVAGTLFGKDDARIVKIDEYRVDAKPSGYMLISKYKDKPKVIGPVGLILGENDINIAGMQVGRESIGGDAIMVLNIDSPVQKSVLNKLNKVDGIKEIQLVKF